MTTDTAKPADGTPQIVAQVQLITRCGCTRVHTVMADEMPEVIRIRLHDYDGDGKPLEYPHTADDHRDTYRSFRYQPSKSVIKWPVYVEEA